MMKEVKFRVCNKDKQMFYPDESYVLFFRQGGESPDFWEMRIEKMPLKICDNKSGILMQSIGLRDKNGKEIYEGDIIRYKYNDTNSWKERTELVHWLDNLCGFFPLMVSLLDINEKVGFVLDYDSIEVIGNIYENSELIE